MTVADAKAAFDMAEIFSPEPPRPLRRELPSADPFPIDALGDVLGPAAQGINDKVQAPLAICSQAVLTAATLAAQGHADVQLPTGQTRPLSSYCITIAASGERKTSADREALWPIHKHEETLRARYEADLPGYRNARDAWEKQRHQILGDKKRYPDPVSKRDALDALGPEPVAPLTPMLVCPEPTFEGLERLFPGVQPSMGVFSGEGGQFIGGHGMRDEAKLRTAAALSNMWDGAAIRRVRAGDGALLLPGRRLSLHLMVQPEVASVLLSDRLLSDQGLLSRLLVTAPPAAAGARFWREPKPESDLTIRRYGARLGSILEAPLPLASGKPNELSPPLLTLSPRAKQMLIGFSDHIEREMGCGGSLEPIRGLANKLPEHAARLSGVLALVDNIEAREISCSFMAAGITLAQHYAAEALRLFEAGSVRPEIVRAEQLLRWLHELWTEPLVSLPDIYQRGPNAIRDHKAALETVAILETYGWLMRVDGGGVVNGTRRKDVWRIVRRLP